MHFKGFFFFFIDMNPIRPKLYTILAFMSAVGLKKNNCAFKGHIDHIFAVFYYSLTVKSRYMHFEKKKTKKNFPTYLP